MAKETRKKLFLSQYTDLFPEAERGAVKNDIEGFWKGVDVLKYCELDEGHWDKLLERARQESR